MDIEIELDDGSVFRWTAVDETHLDRIIEIIGDPITMRP